ncbi:hypothetical protein PRZ48_000145 [Zasmidium cellare]|uniref:Rhodopsin domain-containing protein n=1 Tax=Zasmidium cellare TaxID=395010 RepID=A0ABR0EZC3_ZASCE|nr:hypothetical protein PRZ48_000145 [Zasmidium cellare]
MSLWLIWSLKTTLSNKVTVIVTFGARLVLVAIVALRLKSFNRSGQTSDPTLLEAEFIVWTSTELNYSVISATFPIMRPFVNNLTTNYGGRGSGGSDCISQKRGDNVTADIHGRHNETLRRWSSPQDVDARESTTSVKESVSDKTQG